MGMFTRSIHVLPFGNIVAKGQSKVWECAASIPSLGDGFLVRVWGTEEGPTASQCSSFQKLIVNASSIRATARPSIADYLNSCGMVPAGTMLTSDNIWDILKPNFIEVHRDHEYCLGAGSPGTNAISVGYEIPWEAEHLLQLAVLDGVLDQVYSE